MEREWVVNARIGHAFVPGFLGSRLLLHISVVEQALIRYFGGNDVAAAQAVVEVDSSVVRTVVEGSSARGRWVVGNSVVERSAVGNSAVGNSKEVAEVEGNSAVGTFAAGSSQEVVEDSSAAGGYLARSSLEDMAQAYMVDVDNRLRALCALQDWEMAGFRRNCRSIPDS